MNKTMLYVALFCAASLSIVSCQKETKVKGHLYNGSYTGDNLNRIAFPIGGIGTGMFCLEGTGAISHMSLRHQPNLFFEPCMFAAIHVKGIENSSKILEGPVPEWKKFGSPWSGLGMGGTSWGLPRFDEAIFCSKFPFAKIALHDEDIPLQVEISGWNPFIPTEADASSLPVAALEYHFTNSTSQTIEAIFSYHSKNMMAVGDQARSTVKQLKNGFILSQESAPGEEQLQGDFAIYTDDDHAVINHCWFRGGWWDSLTMTWNDVMNGEMRANQPVEDGAPGASLSVPFEVKAGETRTIRLLMAWYVPYSKLRIGLDAVTENDKGCSANCDSVPTYFEPWYGTKFKDIRDVSAFWLKNYEELKKGTTAFTDAFYSSTLPPEVIEAVSANLTTLKSPTVMRQQDGRLWNYEGCGDTWGSCHGSCTHVWNYAQAIPHLFPALERTLRETEFYVSQNKEGHQAFRSNLPIRPVKHDFHSAADGQLGGIVKVYRDWRIYGDREWLLTIYPQVKESMDYCIATWDPQHQGALIEPHHNTYDIEFWGPDGMCTSFYASALKSIVLMGTYLSKDVSLYESLLLKSKKYMENELYNQAYFIQNIRWKDLQAADPTQVQSFHGTYSEEARAILEKEGPKYQYGEGCLSDGIIGCWMALTAGMEEPIDKEKVKSHLLSVYKYNFKKDLHKHANPQRPTFAMGKEGGLLLCTWPKGDKLNLPFVYSDEVWTGIEYQVAAHLIFEGELEKGLDIVRTCRDRYDGRVRNPFNEYECGSWYARAMSSYSLLQALTGVRYDAVDQTLYVDSKIGSRFKTFLSTESGFGVVELLEGNLIIHIYYGQINVKACLLSGVNTPFKITSKS